MPFLLRLLLAAGAGSLFLWLTDKIQEDGSSEAGAAPSAALSDTMGGSFDPELDALLATVGIKSLDALLERAATREDRDALAEQLGVEASRLVAYVGYADLQRINGVGDAYARLLRAAGIKTVTALKRRKPENLHTKLSEINAEQNVVEAMPSVEDVADWVTQAKELPRAVEY